MPKDVTDIRVHRSIKANAQVSTTRALLAKLQGQHFGGARDLYEVFGYPRGLEAADYEAAYKRQDIGGRIIDAFPDATWREPPIIKAESDESGEGAFAKAFEELCDKYKLWYVLSRLDRLMGMGHYGALLIGLDGGEPLDQPVKGRDRKLLYLTPHGERTADVTWWDNNPQSPRYGKPELYSLITGVGRTGHGGGERRITAHHSRVLHVAERALDDEAIGQPRLERVWNRLMDVDKLLGGSAEVYWQNAAMIRAWTADADVEWDPEEQEAMEKQLEELMHGLRRDVRMRGVTASTLAGSFSDPAGAFEKALDMIAGAIGIPKRILIGSERGELSSEQDESNWASRIAERREQFATPQVIRPFIDKLIEYGILKAPEGGKYTVEWPESDGLSEMAQADIADKRTSALQKYVSSPGSDIVVPVEEFRSRFLGLDPTSEYESDPLETPELDETDPNVIDQFAANRLNTNAEARTLFARRNVVNAKDIIAWARAQGFESIVPADEMHVTIAYSHQPLDWMKIGETWGQEKDGTLRIVPGGVRLVERLGHHGEAVVLMFTSSDLTWRHMHIKECGASWKWDDYQPHITITYKGAPELNVEEIAPYRGPIILGPEIFEEINEDFNTDDVEN